MHVPVFDLEDTRRQVVDEIAVVRDQHHRSVVLAQGVEQDVLGAHIQVISGLIEQQEIRGGEQHASQRVAVAFAAGEHADALERIVIAEQE